MLSPRSTDLKLGINRNFKMRPLASNNIMPSPKAMASLFMSELAALLAHKEKIDI